MSFSFSGMLSFVNLTIVSSNNDLLMIIVCRRFDIAPRCIETFLRNMATPYLVSELPLLAFFYEIALNEIRDKHKVKTMRENYLFLFK